MKLGDKGYLAAGLGASCCLLPLALIALGLGSSLLTVVLIRYKIYLMTGALTAMVFAWWQYARDARRCASGVCEMTGGRFRRWMLGGNTVIVFFFFLITYTPLGAFFGVDVKAGDAHASAGRLPARSALGATASPQVGSAGAGVAVGEKTRMERLALRVEGMT